MKKLLLITALLIISYQPLHAQCSDAGVCSIGSLHDAAYDEKQFKFGSEYQFGTGSSDDEIKFHTISLKANARIFCKTYLIADFPIYKQQNGPLGTVSGIGDLLVLFHTQLYEGDEIKVAGEVGGKFATGNENANEKLPQVYQPGLGTNDLLLGLSLHYSEFTFAAGYQLAEKKHNDNLLKLKRGDDIFGQIGYTKNFDIWSLTGEILAIKRLQKSEIIVNGKNSAVDKSDQLQINIAAKAAVDLDEHLQIRLFTAVPLLKRDVNVDGLTRSFSVSLGVFTNI